MAPRGFDPKAIAGKHPAPDRHTDVLVIGAGPAGIAAALAAATAGEQVLLIDENPVAAGLMGLDTPLYYGGRYTSAVQTKARMLEQVFAAKPDLEAAIEAGVEVELGVYCWGAWVPGQGLAALPSPVAGLADDEKSWMVGFKRIIVATGARDVAFAFPGWDQPGVMGARALHALTQAYDAFAGRRLVILGSGDLALEACLAAIDKGLDVVALIEIEETALGSADLIAAVARAGILVLTNYVPVRADGGLDGVERLTVRHRADGAKQTFDCDTVVQAIAVTPVIELLDVLGAARAMQPALGGHAPVSPDGAATSLPQVSLAGDVAGVKLRPRDSVAYQQAWMRALIAAADADVIVCQCEEVTRDALLHVRQPTYLGPPSPGMTRRPLASLLEDGPVNQDQIKRLTRACMGACQARRCREQVALTLACASNQSAADIPLAGYRAPVRPLPLCVLAADNETPEMAGHWDVWFGIAGQWVPYADVGTEREALHKDMFGGDMHL